ncbi:hypothetical protein [Sphingomonas bacterium]|uniref:hypothetical protein n=1 Tax=Sphingomonas bacterium TaxID=1895847 RepID=UPI00157523AB|nr:hypothetical protein [Sphingomonas bacterium]
MLLDVAGQVRRWGQTPVVLPLQDRGYGDDLLYRLVGPALDSEGINGRPRLIRRAAQHRWRCLVARHTRSRWSSGAIPSRPYLPVINH